jgi:hypothetical protein
MLAGHDDCGLAIADCGFEDKGPAVRARSQFAIRNPQLKDGASSRCCPGTNSLQKKSTGCCMEAHWLDGP